MIILAHSVIHQFLIVSTARRLEFVKEFAHLALLHITLLMDQAVCFVQAWLLIALTVFNWEDTA
jgi:hypothetical protein